LMDEFKAWINDPNGGKMPVGDEAPFKESQHPRAKNGQFGSGGASGSGGGSTQAKSPIGSKKDALPALAKSMTEAAGGKPPTPEEFHEKVTSLGVSIIPAQSVKYLKMYLSEKKKTDAEKSSMANAAATFAKFESEKPAAAAKEAPKAKEYVKSGQEMSHEFAKGKGFANPTAMIASDAEKAGYKPEGQYNGKFYHKSASGDKVSYDPAADTWITLSAGSVTAQGQGAESLSKYLSENKAKPAAQGTMAAAPVSTSHASTATAKKYGDVIPAEKFSFASSGIANETALPTKVKESIRAYKGSSYQTINNAMRFNESFDPDTVSSNTMAHILNLQRAFAAVAPSTKDVTVGRKITSDGLMAMAKDAGLASLTDLKAGMILREPGIVSTSHDQHVWSGDVKFEIKLPKGSKAIDISETVTLHQSEQEVLLGPDSKLKIHEVKQNHTSHGKQYAYHIVCELMQ